MTDDSTITLDQVADCAQSASQLTRLSVDRITQITLHMNILALNAKIEAARAGQQGAGVSIVADEVLKIGREIGVIAGDLGQALAANMAELERLVSGLSLAAQGARLVDLAFSAIDIMDRNLYERSCDVRWWATGSDVVAGLTGRAKAAHAASRMGVILEAYTVYLDLWLIDRDGQIVANGRPERYKVAGQSVAQASWFRDAKTQKRADDFAVGLVAPNPLLSGAQSMIWACGVRENGQLRGVLATQFDWEPQARAILMNLPLETGARAMLCDKAGRVLAASDGKGVFAAQMALPTGEAGWSQEGRRMQAAHRTRGFETWRGQGWYGVIEQSAPEMS